MALDTLEVRVGSTAFYDDHGLARCKNLDVGALKDFTVSRGGGTTFLEVRARDFLSDGRHIRSFVVSLLTTRTHFACRRS